MNFAGLVFCELDVNFWTVKIVFLTLYRMFVVKMKTVDFDEVSRKRAKFHAVYVNRLPWNFIESLLKGCAELNPKVKGIIFTQYQIVELSLDEHTKTLAVTNR